MSRGSLGVGHEAVPPSARRSGAMPSPRERESLCASGFLCVSQANQFRYLQHVHVELVRRFSAASEARVSIFECFFLLPLRDFRRQPRRLLLTDARVDGMVPRVSFGSRGLFRESRGRVLGFARGSLSLSLDRSRARLTHDHREFVARVRSESIRSRVPDTLEGSSFLAIVRRRDSKGSTAGGHSSWRVRSWPLERVLVGAKKGESLLLRSPQAGGRRRRATTDLGSSPLLSPRVTNTTEAEDPHFGSCSLGTSVERSWGFEKS